MQLRTTQSFHEITKTIYIYATHTDRSAFEKIEKKADRQHNIGNLPIHIYTILKCTGNNSNNKPAASC